MSRNNVLCPTKVRTFISVKLARRSCDYIKFKSSTRGTIYIHTVTYFLGESMAKNGSCPSTVQIFSTWIRQGMYASCANKHKLVRIFITVCCEVI